MRTLITLLIGVVLLSPATSDASKDWGQTLTGFVKGGLAVSTLYGDDVENVQAGFGWTLGVGGYLPFNNPKLGLQAELNYTVKKAFADVVDPQPGEPPILSVDYTFDYLEIPLEIFWAFTNDPDWRWYVNAGPVISFLLNAKASYVAYGVEHDEEVTGLDSTAFGFLLGVGVQATYIMAEIGYNIGLNKIGGDGSGTSSADYSINTMLFRMGVAF